jgi:dienelactone hydrolase
MLTELTFPSVGVDCHAWHVPATDARLQGPAGRPVVVMAHGFGGTKDSGLQSFAEHLASAGMDVLAFDYRGFGESGGEPRQVVSLKGQAEDYRSAVAAAAKLPGVDARRIVLWGVSLSGGTVLEVAAGRGDIAAVVSLTPLVSGFAAARSAPSSPPQSLAHQMTLIARDKLAAARRTAPVTMKIVGHPGDTAALTFPGMYDEYLSIVGPSWRNEIGASIAMEVFARRSASAAAKLRVPVLIQVADYDQCAPAHAAMTVAVKARAQVRHYPCDHFDVYPGKRWHDAVVSHQIRFLTAVLKPPSMSAP